MGIKSLTKFLKGQCPEVFEPIHLSEYAYKKVAIDTSLYLCNYKALTNDPLRPKNNDWLALFIKLVTVLRKNNVHCVFIYDSGAPPEKEAERAERAEQRAKLAERVYKLEEAIDQYDEIGRIDQVLVDFQTKRRITMPSLLRPGKVAINIKEIKVAVNKLHRQMFEITPSDFQATKKLFDIFNVPYLYAPLEAETLCADLCKRGIVDAVLSDDSDVMAYGADIFLTKINVATETCLRVRYSDLLERLGYTTEQFLDFCIMCGTDYNKNIFRVGPSKSYKYITDHKNIETISEKTTLDVSILKHVRGRELFRDYEKPDVTVQYCDIPDFFALAEFIQIKNMKVDISAIESCFKQKIVIMKNDEVKMED